MEGNQGVYDIPWFHWGDVDIMALIGYID